MRFLVLVLVLLLVPVLEAQRAPLPQGNGPALRGRATAPERRAVDRGAAERVERRSYLFTDTNERLEYAVFVSTRVDRTKPSPLVIALHGLGSRPGQWLTRIAGAAEDAGYIVATPMGYNVEGWYGANGPSSGRRAPSNLGELSEKDVMNVLDLMRKEFNVDARRIYLAGHSMGGAGALYLGMKHKNIWAAVAASAPAVRMNLHTPSELEEALEMPMMLIHGDADRSVPVGISRQWAAKMKDLKMTYEYHELRGVGHDSLRVVGPYIFDFFDKHLKPEAGR